MPSLWPLMFVYLFICSGKEKKQTLLIVKVILYIDEQTMFSSFGSVQANKQTHYLSDMIHVCDVSLIIYTQVACVSLQLKTFKLFCQSRNNKCKSFYYYILINLLIPFAHYYFYKLFGKILQLLNSNLSFNTHPLFHQQPKNQVIVLLKSQ